MQEVMQQVWKIMQVRKWWDIEHSTRNSTEQDSVIIIIRKEDMVAIISGKRVTAIFSSKVDTIYSRDQPVTNLSSKQVVIIISNTIHY